MQANDGGRYTGSSNAYSPNMRRPAGQGGGGKRTALKIAACLLLPPVGLVWIWRTGSFALRGRMITSFFSFAVMLAACLPLFSPANIPTVEPVAVSPVAATHAPEEDAVTALSNIEELLMQQEAAESAALEEGETAPAPESAALTLEQIYNTTVYSVYNNAQYYHVGPTCNGQQNGRSLTIRQALDLGLEPCPDCNPPSTADATDTASTDTGTEETATE